MIQKILEFWGPIILRFGMAAVILWFGWQQALHAEQWAAYVPDSAVALTGFNALGLVYLNAVFEAVFGLLLLFGLQTRLVSFLLSAHLFGIVWTVGYGEIGVRDFGLAIATLVVFINGPDAFCLQQRKVESIVKAETQS